MSGCIAFHFLLTLEVVGLFDWQLAIALSLLGNGLTSTMSYTSRGFFEKLSCFADFAICLIVLAEIELADDTL